MRIFLGFLFFLTATLLTTPVFAWDLAVNLRKGMDKKYHQTFLKCGDWILKTTRKIDGGF
jgi:hypothetical protein